MKKSSLKQKSPRLSAIEKIEKSLSKESIDRAKSKSKEILFQINLSELRKSIGMKQEEITSFSQSSLSKLETRKDMKISTLKDYLNSLDMDLEIKAKVRNPQKNRNIKKEYVLLRSI
ncbi:XRE family transcriptional regulator [Leptospira sp. GIMC2001]|uniref:XRE family transcriptional regulator n=1 Tax=Leptospira sp. GIMC2001 TaxID=1513297 RepID=UPI00234A5164|nr:XRE family transcriptional regulator [Leptospira sp. GIMC2001]WCL50677.1 XRE family transcriptional regulator [Leptospira sp. GIMC2001]WCL50711.1 XRE family transcriptional regulator [Leptospira sp. GIMC2001]